MGWRIYIKTRRKIDEGVIGGKITFPNGRELALQRDSAGDGTWYINCGVHAVGRLELPDLAKRYRLKVVKVTFQGRMTSAENLRVIHIGLYSLGDDEAEVTKDIADGRSVCMVSLTAGTIEGGRTLIRRIMTGDIKDCLTHSYKMSADEFRELKASWTRPEGDEPQNDVA